MVSIIIPVYNSEKTLNRCVQSVLNQTYQEWELLLINDGSADNSLDVCYEFEKRDSRIQVYSQNNKGVSAARNLGIGKAQGEYIYFCDSDDEMDRELLEYSIHSLEKEAMDLVWFDMIEIQQGREDKIAVEFLSGTFEQQDSIVGMVMQNYLKCQFYFACWNKVYRTDLIKRANIRFDETLTMGEDYFFNMEYLLHCKKVKGLNRQLYAYHRSTESVTFKDKMLHINGYNTRLKGLFDKYKFTMEQFQDIYFHSVNNQVIKKESMEQLRCAVKYIDCYIFYRNCLLHIVKQPLYYRRNYGGIKSYLTFCYMLWYGKGNKR